MPPQLLRALRTQGWVRTVAIRRLAAAALVAAAAFLALRPSPARDAPMLVASRDLAPGVALSTEDIKVVRAPPSLIPAGALTEVPAAAGQILTGAAAAGEAITATRLLGTENIRLTSGLPDASAVPVRLADPGVAELLTPGSKVDVVAPDQSVLASAATVLTVRAASTGPGRLVVLALPRDSAPRVAAASLTQEVTVTLR